MAERRCPVALVAEVVPPREQPKREAVQDVLAGEADGAVNLVRDRSALLRRLGRADFRGGDLEENRVIECAGMRNGVGRGAGCGHRGGDLAGEPCKAVLHRLKLADSAIAATALFTGTKLLTRNTRDFKNVFNLAVQRI